MERTISVMTGKGSITHNERKFTAKNVDESRSVKLKVLIKNLTIRCVQLTESNEKLEKRVKKQDEDIDFYKGKISEQYNKIVGLKERSDDLERVKSYLGEDETQEIIDSVKEMEQAQRIREQQQRKSHRGWGR